MKRITIHSIQLLACLSLAVLVVTCVPTSQHPQRAVRNTCVDCHKEMAEKYQQGHVHAPVRNNNCEACHQPHGLIGGLFLRKNEPNLCLNCHRQLAAGADKKSVHKPVAKGKCSTCHNPHNSQYPLLLNAAADESCFACHDRAPFNKANIHAPLQKDGCKTCHNPHMADQPHLLIADANTLCSSCHQTSAPSFQKSHTGYPVKNACIQCHSPHRLEQKGPLKGSGPQSGAKRQVRQLPSGYLRQCHQRLRSGQ